MTIYQALVAAGCTIDSHESDLYVQSSPEADRIIASTPCNAKRFVSNNGGFWWDLPFAYDPFWDKVAARAAR